MTSDQPGDALTSAPVAVEKPGPAPHVHGPNCRHDHDHHHAPLLPFVRATPKLGRNDPCTCGSGLKFKKCCGK